MGKLRFRPRRVPTLLVVCSVPIFLFLGFWQLDRADQKQELVDLKRQREHGEAVRLTAMDRDIDALRYRKVIASGKYDAAKQFLLDNQVHHGVAGYHVLTPLRLDAGPYAVLVNRGWMPVGRDRSRLPDVSIGDDGPVLVSGVVERFPVPGLRLRGAEKPADGWPALVQVVDPESLSGVLGYPLLPYQILLEPGREKGYVRDWKAAAFAPEKHLGYALQWFSFALAAAVMYLWTSVAPPPHGDGSL